MVFTTTPPIPQRWAVSRWSRHNYRADARLHKRVLHCQPVAAHRIVPARLATCRHHQQPTACMPILPILIVPKRIPSRQVILHTRPTPAVRRSVIHPHRHTATPDTTHIPILLPVQHIPLLHPRTVAIIPVLIRHLHAARSVIPLYLHQPTLLVIPKHPRITVRLIT